MASISKEKPATTIFADVEGAKEFVFDLDGSCGYCYERDMLSFQKIDYPPWDMYSATSIATSSPSWTTSARRSGSHAELDCVLFMQDTKQTWGTSWLYRNLNGGCLI